MESWKEHPHLFAGGRFRANTKYSINHKIVGALNDDGSLVLKDDVEDEIFYEYADNCTLIARRIEDLDESEHREILQADGFKDKDLERAVDEGRADLVMEFIRSSLDGALELLDRGVYPGPQSHFDLPDDDPAKVIDKKSI